MHFHLPKPLHGWRELAGEVGIIVLGVIIALGAEEVARSIADHREAAHLRQSMMNELSSDRARWEANQHDFRCTMKLLDDLRNWSERPGFDRLDHFNPPLFWTMHDSAWQIARSSPIMLHCRLTSVILWQTLTFSSASRRGFSSRRRMI